ncbi:MAG: hypothetical protein PHC98_00170 [Syntrophotalea acetylenica]|nr:hypothetical protein [Syntrophotalea acetylenica]
MPKVFRVDDERWAQTFRFNCDELQFRFDSKYPSETPDRIGKVARECVNKGNEYRLDWTHRNIISFCAVSSVRSTRVKQSAVTTAMESIEFLEYTRQKTLQSSSTENDYTLDKELIDQSIKQFVNLIGRLTYYYTTSFSIPSLIDTRDAPDAAEKFKRKINKLPTDHFYLVRCHVADIIADKMLDVYPSLELLQRTLAEYVPETDHPIPPKERANLRKRIARQIDSFSKSDLAYEAAFFAVDNCACEIQRKIYSSGFRPPRTQMGPKRGCHHFQRLPLALDR